MSTARGILSLVQVGLPPIGKRILVHEIRKSTGQDYWSVGTPFLSKKQRLVMGIEGQSGIVMLSKNTRWILLPETELTALGKQYAAEAEQRRAANKARRQESEL